MKIKKQWNKNVEQTQEIEEQSVINKNNLENINQANLIDQYIKKFTNLSTEFVHLNFDQNESFVTEQIFNQNLFFEWIIDLGSLPENLIPYLNIQILYKSPENLLQRDFDDSLITFRKTYIIQIVESSRMTLIANIFVQQRIDPLDIQPFSIADIEAKLLITLQNPNDYV